MRLRGSAAAGGQDELLQRRQLGVVVRQRLVQLQHRRALQQLVAGDAELAAQVEQLVLDGIEQRAHILRQRLAQQQPELRVELIDLAHGVDAQAALAHALVVAQPGGAGVAGAGGDLRQAITHGLDCGYAI